MSRANSRIQGLDGLRGVAILLVMAQHLFNFMRGWIGVDVFFVLSGFLITTILLAERERAHFWKAFYIRRATRILPPLLLLFAVAATVVTLHPFYLWLMLLLPTANFAVWRYPDLYETGLLVLWSLAVEEQFYLVWPWLVRRLHRRQMVKILLALIVVEPLARVAAYRVTRDWRFDYHLTPFRLDGMAMGALLAILFTMPQYRQRAGEIARRWLPVGVLTLLCMLPLLNIIYHGSFRALVGHSTISLVSALAVADIMLRRDGLTNRLLSARVLVFFGKISYGLYLCHMLVMILLRRLLHVHGDMRLPLISLLASILVASLSFRFYEMPILAWGRRKVHQYKQVEEESAVEKIAVQQISPAR